MAKEDLVLIWYKSQQVLMSKKRIIEIFNKENAKRYEETWNKYYKTYRKKFSEIYDIILENIDNIGTIQIYQDNIIRLHLKHGHYEKPKTIIFSATEDEITKLKQIFKIAI